MTQRRNKCVFCGSYGASKEHIIAQWIGRSMRDAIDGPGVTVRFQHRSANPEAGIGPSEKTAGGTAFTTRAFCRECNGGWMAKLEEMVRPILEPMIHGQSVLIGNDAAELLSFWVAKTILAFQALESKETTFAREDEFREVGRLRTAPKNSQIWVGAVRSGGEMLYRAHSTRLRESELDTLNGYGATLIVGHAAFYLLQSFDGHGAVRLSHNLTPGVVSIRPASDGARAWPPRGPLRYDSDRGLAEAFIKNSVLIDPALGADTDGSAATGRG